MRGSATRARAAWRGALLALAFAGLASSACGGRSKPANPGRERWSRRVSAWSAAAFDASGALLLAGPTSVEKRSATGDPVWVTTFAAGQAVATDTSGNVYVAGHKTVDYTPAQAGEVAKLTADGAVAWARTIATPEGDWVTGVAADGSGNVFVSGYTAGSLDGNDELSCYQKAGAVL